MSASTVKFDCLCTFKHFTTIQHQGYSKKNPWGHDPSSLWVKVSASRQVVQHCWKVSLDNKDRAEEIEGFDMGSYRNRDIGITLKLCIYKHIYGWPYIYMYIYSVSIISLIY